MKKTILVILMILIGTTLSFAKTKDIRFSLVLTEQEAQTIPNKKFNYAPRPGEKAKDIFVSNEPLLSREDINAVIVVKKQDPREKQLPAIDLVFTLEGAKKLEDVTSKNLRRSIAFVAGDQVVSAPYIIYPLSLGHMMLSSWTIATDDSAKNFVNELGFKPIPKEQVDSINQR